MRNDGGDSRHLTMLQAWTDTVLDAPLTDKPFANPSGRQGFWNSLAALPELFLAVLLRTEFPASGAEGLVDTWKEMDERASWCGPLSTLVRPLWSFVLE